MLPRAPTSSLPTARRDGASTSRPRGAVRILPSLRCSPPPASAEPCDAIVSVGIAGRVLPAALRHLRPGGTLVFAAAAVGETLPALDYARHLDRERSVASVSAAPRGDVVALLALAAGDPSLRPPTESYPLASVPEALQALKGNRVRGAAVLITAPRP